MRRVGILVLTVVATFAMSPAPADATPKKGRGRGRDTAPPTIVVPADITVDAMATLGSYVAYTMTVTDDKDPSPTVTCSHPSGSTFPVGTTTVTVTATDWRDNMATSTFDVTVLAPAADFHYEMAWWAWDYEFNQVVWYSWSITVAPDGTVSGSGEQLYLLEAYLAYYEEYAVPMPADLTGSGTISGTISPDGSSAIDMSLSYWYSEAYDYGDEGVLTEYSYDFSGAAQASLDANGNLAFSGGYYAVWTKVS